MNPPSKFQNTGLTIFSVMSQLASEHGAINLSQGFPDFDVHPDLITLVEKQMRKGHNQYAPMQGVLALREKLSEKTAALYGKTYDPIDEITVTSGGTEALFAAISAVVHPGDEVIVFEPAFDSYAPAIELNGGKPVYIKLKHPEYAIDWDEVRSAVHSRTRLMILNSPHNPTGSVLSRDDIAKLSSLCASHRDLLLLSDEVYEHIIFDGLEHESIARHPELAERCFVISSFGKTYHTTGWKVGYCLAPKALSREFRLVHQYLTFAVNTPIQYAYAEFMEKKELYQDLASFYQAKRDKFLSLIQGSRFTPLPCRGTYFQMLDYSGISEEKDTDFARRLTVEHGVAAIPPSVFYSDNDDHRTLRFCFAKKDKTLEKAAEKLCRL